MRKISPAVQVVLSLLLLLFIPAGFADGPREVAVDQKFKISPGETVRLKGASFTVKFDKMWELTPCAIPGQNCGAGYAPPQPILKTSCDGKKSCPYDVVSGDYEEKTVTLQIKNRKAPAK